MYYLSVKKARFTFILFDITTGAHRSGGRCERVNAPVTARALDTFGVTVAGAVGVVTLVRLSATLTRCQHTHSIQYTSHRQSRVHMSL